MDSNDTGDLLNQIDKAREAVAQLTSVRARERNNIEHALENARTAGDENDNDWLFEELNKAHDQLNKLAPTVPEAKQLAIKLGAIIQRAMSLLAPQQQGSRSHNQQIGDNAQVGVAVSGDVQGGINYHAPGSGPISGDYVAGDKFTGDKVMGDKVMGDKQVINNHASNQGAQGNFYGPVTFNNSPRSAGDATSADAYAGETEEEARTRQINALREQISSNRTNLYRLKMQVAQFGGDMWTPVGVSNNIDTARKAIRSAKEKLRRLGEEVTDMPDDEE